MASRDNVLTLLVALSQELWQLGIQPPTLQMQSITDREILAKEIGRLIGGWQPPSDKSEGCRIGSIEVTVKQKA